MEQSVLLVDDEPNITSALCRNLRKNDFEIIQACSAKDGLKILEERWVNIIISDQLMPGMTGIDFFAIVKEKYPDTIRILLSGHPDINLLTDAFNQGIIYKFYFKPWDSTKMRNDILEAFVHQEMNKTGKTNKNNFNKTNKCICIFNAEGKIQSVNNSFFKLTGFSIEDLRGKELKFTTENGKAIDFHDILGEFSNKQQQWQDNVWFTDKKNTAIFIEVKIKILEHAKTKVNFYAAIFKKITLEENYLHIQEPLAVNVDSKIEKVEYVAHEIGNDVTTSAEPYDWVNIISKY